MPVVQSCNTIIVSQQTPCELLQVSNDLIESRSSGFVVDRASTTSDLFRHYTDDTPDGTSLEGDEWAHTVETVFIVPAPKADGRLQGATRS